MQVCTWYLFKAFAGPRDVFYLRAPTQPSNQPVNTDCLHIAAFFSTNTCSFLIKLGGSYELVRKRNDTRCKIVKYCVKKKKEGMCMLMSVLHSHKYTQDCALETDKFSSAQNMPILQRTPPSPPHPPTHTRENDTQTGASTSFKVLDKVSRQPLKRPPATSRPVLSSTRVYFKGLKSHLIFDTTLPGHRVQFSSISVFTECPDDKYLYTCSKAITPFKAKIGYRNIRDAHECL